MAVRRFLPTFLAAFHFRTARAGDPLLGAVELLRTFYAHGRTIPPRKAPVSFLKPKWRRIVVPTDGAFNRRAWEIAVLVHLRDRLASGAIWVDGSRAITRSTNISCRLPPSRPCATKGNARLAAGQHPELAGMRGVVTLAVALTLPQAMPGRDLMLVTAFAVTLVTVVVQGPCSVS